MGLILQHRLEIVCPLCKTNAGNDDEHNPECPRMRMKAAVEANYSWSCNRCQGRVEVTIDDFLECRKCRRMYTRGIAPAVDPATLAEDFLRQLTPVDQADNYSKVLVLPRRGKQKRFLLDRTLSAIKADIPNWKIRRTP